MQIENNAGSNASKPEKLLDLLRRPGGISEPLSSVADYVGYVRGITERWQSEDWRQRSRDDACVLNTARIVGQVWFRGHCNCDLSLQPGLYRESVWRPLLREIPDGGSGTDEADRDELLFDDLFDLEHEMRIDFTSYGHLLNESNQGTVTQICLYGAGRLRRKSDQNVGPGLRPCRRPSGRRGPPIQSGA